MQEHIYNTSLTLCPHANVMWKRSDYLCIALVSSDVHHLHSCVRTHVEYVH